MTPFMDDHPGGGEIMLSAAGKDGTQDFEDVGHSPHARTLLQKYYLDEFAGGLGSGGDTGEVNECRRRKRISRV